MKRVNADTFNVDLDPAQARQGDVFLYGSLVKRFELPADAEDITPKSGPVVLALGEATGHKHAFCDGNVRLYSSPTKGRFLRVVKTTSLLHEEHSPAKPVPLIYKLPKQVEYSPRELIRVAD